MMAKATPSWLVVGLTAISSFVLLFSVNLITEPILLNRANERYLDLLNLETFAGYLISDPLVPTGALATAGGEEVKTFSQQNQVIAVTYQMKVTGYNPGLIYRIGIRNGLIQTLRIDANQETPSYGGVFLTNAPDLLAGLPINDEAGWTAALVATSSGVTFTRNGLLNSLQAIKADYAERIG